MNFFLTLFFALLLFSCSNNNTKIIDRPLKQNIIQTKLFSKKGPVSVKRYDYPAIGDTSVSIAHGGIGFEDTYWKEHGWQTNTDFIAEGSDKAIKGGTFNVAIGSYPSMYRTEGRGSNQTIISTCTFLLYENLLSWDRHHNFTPLLASHWKIENEGQTISLRINPKARWSDGFPVTADDVIATYKLLTDAELRAPYTKENYEQFSVKKLSKYIVKFQFKKKGWRNTLNAGLWYQVYPAHHLNKISGSTYLEKYQYTALPGTGPYVIDYDQTIKGKRFVLRRRKDYWGKDLPQNKGQYNYDKIVLKVIGDASLQYETFKKGDIDIYYPSSKEWVQDFDLKSPGPGMESKLPNGIIQKRKVFAYSAKSFNGMALNMRKPPFNDIRVRKAFAMLYNRKQICEKLEFNQKTPIGSHWPYSENKHPSNKAVEYNPKEANRLLDEAGWNLRDSEGYRMHPDYGLLEMTVNITKSAEKQQTIFQQALKKSGIKYHVNITTWPTMSKILDERRFKVQPVSWGAASLPNLESKFNSKLGKQDNTNNMTGLDNPALDSLGELYKITFDSKERTKIIQKVDSIAYNEYHYVFGIGVPYSGRFAYINKFGTLKSVFAYRGGGLWTYWWIDPKKDAKIKKALAGDKKIFLPVGETIADYWHLQDKDEKINNKGQE